MFEGTHRKGRTQYTNCFKGSEILETMKERCQTRFNSYTEETGERFIEKALLVQLNLLSNVVDQGDLKFSKKNLYA